MAAVIETVASIFLALLKDTRSLSISPTGTRPVSAVSIPTARANCIIECSFSGTSGNRSEGNLRIQ